MPAVRSKVSPGKKKPTNMPDSAKMMAAISSSPPAWISSATSNMSLKPNGFYFRRPA